MKFKNLNLNRIHVLKRFQDLTSEEAKRMLVENMVSQAKVDSSVIIKEIHDRQNLMQRGMLKKLLFRQFKEQLQTIVWRQQFLLFRFRMMR
jgi:hypothetical protein